MLTPEQITGLVHTTQELIIKKGAYTNLRTDLTEFVGVNELFKRHSTQFEGGLDWRFDVVEDHNHSARVTSLYDEDSAAIDDALLKGSVGPRFVDASYVFDVREQKLQGSSTQVIDYVRTKYEGMLHSWYELLEDIIWSKPADASDKRTPYGIAYWITKDDQEGFFGGNPVGFVEGRAGIDSAAHPRWKNYTGKYAAVTKESLIKMMRKAVRKTNFVSPVSNAEPTFKTGNGIYVNDNVLGQIEEILEAQNMNLGNDVASKDGRALFKGHPLVYVPKLDADSSNPVYMIDWSTMAFGTLKGWDKHVSAPQIVPNRHNVRAVFLDSSVNTICTNLRKNAVFHQAA